MPKHEASGVKLSKKGVFPHPTSLKEVLLKRSRRAKMGVRDVVKRMPGIRDAGDLPKQREGRALVREILMVSIFRTYYII